MKKVFYLFVIASLGFTSCASFDHINSYSKTAVQGIEESDDINLSFTNICQQYSRSAFQYSIRINPTIVKPIPSCDDEILADSSMGIILVRIQRYILNRFVKLGECVKTTKVLESSKQDKKCH
jgi:hypothetical protein